MIVLSRRINESVVVADHIIVTLVRLLPERVELTLRDTVDELSSVVTLELGEFVDVGLGVRLTLAEVRASTDCAGPCCGGPKARLAFEAPMTVSVCRKEVWDMNPARGPGWLFPKYGSTPLPN